MASSSELLVQEVQLCREYGKSGGEREAILFMSLIFLSCVLSKHISFLYACILNLCNHNLFCVFLHLMQC